MIWCTESTGEQAEGLDMNHPVTHRPWLDFDATHQEAPCRKWFSAAITEKNAPLFCSQVVEELLYLSISSIFKASSLLRLTEMKYMHQIRRLFRVLPHSIKFRPHSGGLLVTWDDNEAGSFRNLGGDRPEYRVVFHAEERFIASSELLHSEAGKFLSSKSLRVKITES